MYAIRHGRLERVPDLVVYPSTEEQVTAIVEAAARHDVCLVPYGGGTNVTDALRCPVDEERSIVSVDLTRLDRILWIDPVNLMACIEAGAVGRQLQAELARHGFTLGHEPDSVEFSTLGGWIATHASGMKKNRYGNIEDLVLDVHVVTRVGSALAPARRAPGVGRPRSPPLALRLRGHPRHHHQRGGEDLPASRGPEIRFGALPLVRGRGGDSSTTWRARAGRRPACGWWTTSSSSSARP